jgi:hypothetical protein
MWRCPRCETRVDDEFEVCWACGTSADGVEDPTFLTADEEGPIEEPPIDTEGPMEDPLADFAGTPMPELVECFMASNTIEAKFVADQLIEQGIPAVADHHDNNLWLGGWKPTMWGYGPKVRVRPEDLARAEEWLKGYRERRKPG